MGKLDGDAVRIGTYDMQRQVSFTIYHLELFSSRIACEYLNDISFLVVSAVFGHPVCEGCQGAWCLGTTLKKHLFEFSLVEKFKELFEFFGGFVVSPGGAVALMHEHAVSHVSSCFVSGSLIGADRDEVRNDIFTMHVCCEMEGRPAF